ncbi:MAG: DNA-directed RNA polymerase [Patescibacteria group bacterium]
MTYQQDNSGSNNFSGSDNQSRGGDRGGFRGGRGGGFNRGGPREMIDVTAMGIKCADCGVDITQLPFQPDPARLNTIRCRDCLRKSRPSRY